MKKVLSLFIFILFIISALPLSADNPIITSIYTADPAAMVYDDTFYIYCGHDEASTSDTNFYMNDWYVLSSTNMVDWTNHGPCLSISDFSWAIADAWAGHCVYNNGTFWWYVPVNHGTIGWMSIGVASGPSPTGPFTDAKGSAIITDDTTNSSALNIDPCVFVDDDGLVYMVWGCYWDIRMVKLQSNMIDMDGTPVQPSGVTNFWEAPWLFKRDGTYYLLYAAGANPATIEYCTASDPMGPYTYQGVMFGTTSSPTNHPAAVEYKGQWYFVYHTADAPDGGEFRRSVCVDYMYFNSDGTIQQVIATTEGVDPVGDETSAPTVEPTATPTQPPQSQDPIWTGGPYTLNGTDEYVDLPDDITNDLYDFTVATWVNLNSVDAWTRIFDFGNDTTYNMFLTPNNDSDVMRFAITISGNSGEQQIDGSGTVSAGSWQHVAVVKSGDTGILYVNGSEAGSNTGMTLSPADMGTTANNYIGRSQYDDPYLNGSVDDFRIYNRPLSGSEISTLADTPPGSTGTVGDVNEDGAVDIVDALLIAQCYVGLTSCPETAVGDTNCDESVDIIDALLVAQYYVGLVSELGC